MTSMNKHQQEDHMASMAGCLLFLVFFGCGVLVGFALGVAA